MRENLTQKQAFLAMTMFLETYFRQTQADDIGGLLGSVVSGVWKMALSILI